VQFKQVPGPPPAQRPPDAAAVTQAFGLGPPHAALSFAARGELGRIWRLRTDRGRFAVKEIFEPPAESEARADVAFQQMAIADGLPLPTPLMTPEGKVLACVVAGDRTTTVRVYTWVELATPPVAASPRQAAELLGQLHALAPSHPGPVDPWFTDSIAPSRWEEILAAARRTAAPWLATAEALVPDLTAGIEIIRAGRHEPTVHCHLDFNPQNVLITRHGPPVIVDWENSGAASLEQELASVVAEFVPDPKAIPEFLDAYHSAGGPVRALCQESFAMTLAVQSHLVQMYAERALAAAGTQESHDRAIFWLEDIAANVFTTKQVSAWVDSA
jgi:Ser/Thr protein kinase RdoA (MazF antagonist)